MIRVDIVLQLILFVDLKSEFVQAGQHNYTNESHQNTIKTLIFDCNELCKLDFASTHITRKKQQQLSTIHFGGEKKERNL